jgi:hypothetical protein
MRKPSHHTESAQTSPKTPKQMIRNLIFKMSESIGMMDKAYFVGKVVILQWFNELLDVST